MAQLHFPRQGELLHPGEIREKRVEIPEVTVVDEVRHVKGGLPVEHRGAVVLRWGRRLGRRRAASRRVGRMAVLRLRQHGFHLLANSLVEGTLVRSFRTALGRVVRVRFVERTSFPGAGRRRTGVLARMEG